MYQNSFPQDALNCLVSTYKRFDSIQLKNELTILYKDEDFGGKEIHELVFYLADMPWVLPEVFRGSHWDIVKSFQIRSTPCLPPPHDSESTEKKRRGAEIYGGKVSNGLTFSKVHSDTSVPFRSPLTVVLGRSVNASRGKQHRRMMEVKEQHVRGGGTEVLRIFADRYHTKNDKKNLITPLKDNNARRQDGRREHENLETRLTIKDKRYKLYHSESSNAMDTFLGLQNALQKLKESKEVVVIQAANPKVKKKEIKGELGDHYRRRKYRPELADDLNTIRFRKAKVLVDSNGYTNKNEMATSFPITLESKKHFSATKELFISEFSRRSHEGDENGESSHRTRQRVADQASIDWRDQTAVENRWVPQHRGSSKARSVERTKQFRNTADINVPDTKLAKSTLKKLLQETALTQKSDNQVSDIFGDEISMRPTARRRTIRAKCSKRLVAKSDHSEQVEEMVQPNMTENNSGPEVPPLKPNENKVKDTSEEQFPMRPKDRERMIRDKCSERVLTKICSTELVIKRLSHKSEDDLGAVSMASYQNPKENQARDTSDEELRMRPAARRRMIRAKCSELLTTKSTNLGSDVKKKQSTKAGYDSGSEVMALGRKTGTTSMICESELEMKNPPVRKRSSKIRSEVFTVGISRFRGNVSGKCSSLGVSNKQLCKDLKSQRRRPSGEDMNYKSSFENEVKYRIGYDGTARLVEGDIEFGPMSQHRKETILQSSPDNDQKHRNGYEGPALSILNEIVIKTSGHQSIKKGQIPVDLLQGSSRNESNSEVDESRKSAVPVLERTFKESQTEMPARQDVEENEGNETVQERSARSDDITMSMTEGRGKADEKDPVVSNTDSTVVTNKKQLLEDNISIDHKNNLNKETDEGSTKHKVAPLTGPAKSSDYSEIWRSS